MISVIVQNRKVPNVLIDGGSGVSIITDTLKRILGLNKIEPASFTIKMADQRKVMPKRIIRDVHQIMIALEDQLKTSFITKYGAFVYRVMPFGLMCAPATFQRGMMKIIADYLDKIMKVFLDDFTVYGTRGDHIEHLEKCLIKC